MVQELKVTCPHCHQVAEIYLSTNACVIILNCPSCFSPIMYFDHKIFVLSQNQVEAIKNKARSSTMMNMLKKITQPEQLPVTKSSTCQGSEKNNTCTVSSNAGNSAVASHSGLSHIGSDDITNLRIDLGLCNDVLEFINSM